MKYYVATVKVLVKAESEGDASDGICELLNNQDFIQDWCYLAPNMPVTFHQGRLPVNNLKFAYPHEVQVIEPLEEGDVITL